LEATQLPVAAPIKLENDTCIQCHVDGSFTNIWTEAWIPLPQRVINYLDDRFQLTDFLKPILSKPVPDWQRRWWYCLGGLTFFFFIVQGITGIMLAFYYKPTPAEAFASIQFIESEVLLGSAIRMIHHWSANAMIVLACAHGLRVFIMGAPGLWIYRLFAALGSKSLLGNNSRDRNCRQYPCNR
jgi:hypothetical protein